MLTCAAAGCNSKRELASSSASPDHSYVIEIFRIVPWHGVPPGSGSDAQAEVVLKHSTGEVVESWHVEMLQMAGPIEWTSKKVTVGSRTVRLR
jgi:hypothetical protein